MPKAEPELVGLEDAEDPIFCLLEDDDDVTGLTVETDRLLLPHDTKTDVDRLAVHAVITVEIKATVVTFFNIGLT